MRSIYCGHLNKSHVDQEVTLCGWINKRRDLGGLIFVDVRDREGLVQVVFDPEVEGLMDIANKLRQEFCVQIKGVVRARPESQVNKDMATGEVEILAPRLKSSTVPKRYRWTLTSKTRKSVVLNTVILTCVVLR